MSASPSAPLISIIITNHNGAQWLHHCLKAVFAQTVSEFEVIVVDDASTDQSAAHLEDEWPSVRVLRLMKPVHFAAANNRGAQLAQGEWLALLNNDAFPQPDWLEKLLAAADQFPEFTCFASCVLQFQAPDRLDNTGDICHASGAAWHRGLNQPAEAARTYPMEVFSPNGAAAFYRRRDFLEAGGFDERYLSHHEDVDLGFRLRLRGGRCGFIAQAIVYHVGSATYGVETEQTIYRVQRNMIWTYFKNMPATLFWKYLPLNKWVNLVMVAYYLRRGRGGLVLRAKRDALRGLPAILEERKRIQAERRISSAELEAQLERGWLSPFLLGKLGARLTGHKSVRQSDQQ